MRKCSLRMSRATQRKTTQRTARKSAAAPEPAEKVSTGEILAGVDAKKIAALRERLLEWFHKYQRDLPWRRNKDPYRIWLSEIMLQQTRVAAVIPFYERFLEHFPTIAALASAPESEVLRLWAGLGYYSRARNLQRAAQEIVAKHEQQRQPEAGEAEERHDRQKAEQGARP